MKILPSLSRPISLLAAALVAALPALQCRAETGFVPPTVQEPSFADHSVSIADFGAIPDGKTLNTEAFAKAVDAISKQGGGKVVVPPGIWLTGPIRFKSNINLHLEAGALIQFTSDHK